MNPRCGAGHPFFDRFGCVYRGLEDEEFAREWVSERGIQHYWIPCRTLLATEWVKHRLAEPVLTVAELSSGMIGVIGTADL
jgi:hypothetical protein